MLMDPKHATPQDMEALVAFLPILYGTSADLLAKAGLTRSDRASIEHDAQYEQSIEDFFYCAAKGSVMNRRYDPDEASQMLEDEQLVRDASLGQVRTMLTYCIRSERMGPGQLAHFIRRGTVRHLLNRMKAILDTNN